jgi:hypothetical protein
MHRGMLSSILVVVYVVIGVVAASDHHYLVHLDAVNPLVSAVLAILLWPLLFLGVSLHIK